MLKFSVVIPVRAINNFLRENFRHLLQLEYSNFEVLVILDVEGNYDFKGDNRFKLLVVGNRGPGEKRNIGASKARGDVLVFLDDDAYPKNDWLNHASKIFEDPAVYALGAPAVTPPNATFFEKISGRVLESWFTSAGTVYRHLPKAQRIVEDYPTVNLFVRRDVFIGIGGFNTEFWPGEDTKLCLDLVGTHGRGFLYDPRPIVYHHRRTLYRPHLKQISRFGRHRGQFAKIYPKTSRVPSYFVPALFVLGLVVGPVLSFFVPILWEVYFGVILLYLWLLTFEAVRVILKDKSFRAGVYFGFGVFLTHVVYGVNFILGLIRRPTLQLKNFDIVTGSYTEG